MLLLAFESNVVNGFFHAFVSSLRLRSCFIYISSSNGSGLLICSQFAFGAPLAFLLPTCSYKYVYQLVTSFFG